MVGSDNAGPDAGEICLNGELFPLTGFEVVFHRPTLVDQPSHCWHNDSVILLLEVSP